MTVLQPESVAELQSILQSTDRARLIGAETRVRFCTRVSAPRVTLRGMTGITELRAADFVVTVRAGTLLTDLASELAEQGLALPLASIGNQDVTQMHGTVGGLVATGLPHGLEGVYGPIRDWVLGATVVRTNGEVGFVGSKVLKSVAGFDLQKLAVGSRGGLFAISEITFRVWPLAGLQPGIDTLSDEPVVWIGRMRLPDFEELRGEQSVVAACEKSCTIWSSQPLVARSGWWIGLGGRRSAPELEMLERRAKHVMDPRGVLEEGWEV